MRALLVVLLSVPTVAVAQRSADHEQMAASDCERMRKQGKPCKFIDMGKAEEIDGRTIKPDGIVVNAIDFGTHTSLVRIRRDFIAEILKSANDVD